MNADNCEPGWGPHIWNTQQKRYCMAEGTTKESHNRTADLLVEPGLGPHIYVETCHMNLGGPQINITHEYKHHGLETSLHGRWHKQNGRQRSDSICTFLWTRLRSSWMPSSRKLMSSLASCCWYPANMGAYWDTTFFTVLGTTTEYSPDHACEMTKYHEHDVRVLLCC